MQSVKVTASTQYDILIERGILKRAGELIKEYTGARRALLITDRTVDGLYSKAALDSLKSAGIDCEKFVFEDGEEHKSLKTVGDILSFAAGLNFTRSDIFIALGGGIVGDVTGFAASTYLRGVRFVQIPTTLLAAVDSSVGGKTGVNLPEGKNLAGAFHQPSLVLCDPDCFNTLSDALFADGAAESIKYGIIADESLFEIFEFGDVKDNIENIVCRCVEIKSDIVSRDEFDLGERQKLNLGHTLGHAIERCSDFAVSHGHAVAIGTVCACLAAQKLGICKEDISERVKKTMERNGLPVSTDISVHELASVMQRDKKRSSAGINLILPTKIGECILYNTDPNELESIYSL